MVGIKEENQIIFLTPTFEDYVFKISNLGETKNLNLKFPDNVRPRGSSRLCGCSGSGAGQLLHQRFWSVKGFIQIFKQNFDHFLSHQSWRGIVDRQSVESLDLRLFGIH